MDYEKKIETNGSKLETVTNKSKILQEGKYPVHTDNSIQALKESSTIEEVVDKMIKFREDVESRMSIANNKIA